MMYLSRIENVLEGLTMEIIRSSEKQNEVEKESQEEVEGIHWKDTKVMRSTTAKLLHGYPKSIEDIQINGSSENSKKNNGK